MRGLAGKILYVGKAGNLKRRVLSYFVRPLEYRLQKLVSEIKKIDFQKTETSIEALILESQLIKKYKPPYNVREKDDKSFLFVEMTKSKFPQVLFARGKDMKKNGSAFYGPFTSAKSIREAMRIIRKIFPYSVHPPSSCHPGPRAGVQDESRVPLEERGSPSGKPGMTDNFGQRGCFDWQIGLCPGTCVGAIDSKEYAKTIRHIKLFFEGKKRKIIELLQEEMKEAASKEEYEEAEKKKSQIFALQHINDIALISDIDKSEILNPKSKIRVEGYDISNISGDSAVGSMVVFINGKPEKNEYRRFKIKTIVGANDIGMLREVLSRRFKHWSEPALADGNGWSLPSLILIDGGLGQVNAAREILSESGLNIPVVGIAKGAKRKRNDLIGNLPASFRKQTLIQVRDEAHRFAISYHRKLRGKGFIHMDK